LDYKWVCIENGSSDAELGLTSGGEIVDDNMGIIYLMKAEEIGVGKGLNWMSWSQRYSNEGGELELR
jgi:hypothetical protein